MPKSTPTVDQPTDSPAAVPDEDERLLTIADVAERLRCKPWSVYKLCDSGLLPNVYLGPKSRRVRPSDLRAYIAGLPTERPEPANAAG